MMDDGEEEDLTGKSRAEVCLDSTLEYSVESISDDLNDCRLQLVSKYSKGPRWYRERQLNLKDEIEDKLIDAHNGKVVWGSYRPTVGWYLYIKSPSMPKQAAVSLLPIKAPQYGGTPLSFSVTTSLDAQYLPRLAHFIDHDSKVTTGKGTVSTAACTDDERFTAIALGSIEKMAEPKVRKDQLSNLHLPGHARSTSRNPSLSHARQRSLAQRNADAESPRLVSESSLAEGAEGELKKHEDTVADPGVEKGGIITAANSSSQAPHSCHFILSDQWQITDASKKSFLTNWVWSVLPSMIAMPLEKQFSLLWLDAPKSSSTRDSSTSAVEILRYEDCASWSNWRERRRGRIILQHNAIRALQIDIGFWISVALAYLDFIEERDGYHAAMEG